MSRKNRSPEEKARRAKIRELLQMANIPSMVTIMEISVYLEIQCANVVRQCGNLGFNLFLGCGLFSNNSRIGSFKTHDCLGQGFQIFFSGRIQGREKNSRFILAEFIDQCSFSNTASAVNDNAFKLSILISFV